MIRLLFLRSLAFVYLIAFWSISTQIQGLIGSNGITPVAAYLRQVLAQIPSWQAYYIFPSLVWLNSSDACLIALCLGGVVFSLLAILGFIQRIAFVVLWILYLSIVVAANVFLSFQWDSLLLEAGFLGIFLVFNSSRTIIWLFRFLVFKLMFLSGAVKLLSRDTAWWNFTALNYHWYTQPLPTPAAWLLGQLPEPINKILTFMTLFTELLVPFLIFCGKRMRYSAALILIAFQIIIIITGNYTFFNILTIALCLFLFDDEVLNKFLPEKYRQSGLQTKKSSLLSKVVAVCLVISLGFASAGQILIVVFGNSPLFAPLLIPTVFLEPLRVTSTYGLFAVMTKSRLEIVIEGSNDGSSWLPYKFKYKPQDLNRMPMWIAPHQPRLDWQMWFAALGAYQENPWFINFVVQLLKGSPEVLSLLEENPFPKEPPKYIRAVTYSYRFTDLPTLIKTGNWWQREYVREYLPPCFGQGLKIDIRPSK